MLCFWLYYQPKRQVDLFEFAISLMHQGIPGQSGPHSETLSQKKNKSFDIMEIIVLKWKKNGREIRRQVRVKGRVKKGREEKEREDKKN